MIGFVLPAVSLWKREMVRFFRDWHRVIGALGTPIVFWMLLGFGFQDSFRSPGPEGVDYLHYFYPGTIVLVLLFTAIFSTISIIDDRREGFLQSVLVSPASRISVVLGKVLGGTTVAFLQGLLLLALAPILGFQMGVVPILLCAASMFLMAFALTALGFAFAWRSKSTQGFHAIMNLVLFPIWMLSGALFPAEGAPPWLAAVMAVNPLTYGVTALREGLAGGGGPGLAITAAFGAVTFLLSVWVAETRK